MIPTEVEKALTFIHGIAARDAALATRHLHPARYVEHDPRVGDGIGGVRAYIEDLSQNQGGLEVVRTLQDGAFVVTQAHGEVLGRNEFFDVFRFEGGLIVEHWAFRAPGGHPNRSGHTQVDGPRKLFTRAGANRRPAPGLTQSSPTVGGFRSRSFLLAETRRLHRSSALIPFLNRSPA